MELANGAGAGAVCASVFMAMLAFALLLYVGKLKNN